MTENLKTTKFKSGVDIPQVTDSQLWLSRTTSAYCWFDNHATYKNTHYGALYNWFTVSTGDLCPMGWHVPSDIEWTNLSTFLGGDDVAGGMLKETGTTDWNSPNIGATNEAGFTALPGGVRSAAGFYNIGSSGYWWSSTESNTEIAVDRSLKTTNDDLQWGSHSKVDGFSVRCLKDN
jgi:uncharacterized protein (TIGR02145 family)